MEYIARLCELYLNNVNVRLAESYRSLIKDRHEKETERINQCKALVDQLDRKNAQVEAERAHMLAVRKRAMLGRTSNQTLAENRKKVSRYFGSTGPRRLHLRG